MPEIIFFFDITKLKILPAYILSQYLAAYLLSFYAKGMLSPGYYLE